jgi:hypothetical protein
MAYNGYLYIFGGRDETQSGQDDVYYARIYADGTIGSWVATNVLPSNGRVFSGGAIANGYVYLVGGFSGSDTDVTYAKLNLDGTVGSWTTDSDTMPGARGFLTATVNNGYLYALGGNDSVIDTDTVYYTKLNADGSIGSWTTDTSVLPAARNSHTTVTANGYVYVIGGYGGGSVSTVYYASGARLSVGASLDLVGSSGQNLSEGGSGGSITAGNGIFVGSLQVQGSASFGQGLTVAGNLVVSGNVAFTGTLTAGVATFTGTFTVNGHIISGNVSGTTTIVVGAGAGSGASASLSGNDTAGVITINTGTGAAAGDLGTITFGSAYGAAPTVVITPKAIPGGGTYPQYQYDSATGTFTLKSFNALTDSSTYTFSYHIIQ